MTDTQVKTKAKRASKSDRIHQRRLKEAARKPGGALALQMAKVEVATKAAKKAKDALGPAPVSSPKE